MRREDVCGRVIAAPFTWTSVSACALSDRRYIALLCSYTFSILLIHRCVLFRKPFYYLILSLVAIVRGIYFTHEDRVSVL